MNGSDLRLYALNSLTFALSLSNIETALKITLLLVTIGWTLHKWYLIGRRDK
jgi:hypothetical protein